jgi:hypothetical protein
MRLLAVFFTVAALLLGGAALLDWWIDPFGSFTKRSSIDAARRSGCLLSQELVGTTYGAYKLALFERRPTRTFVIGSSRTLKIAAWPGERSFTNMGIPNVTPAELLDVLRAIPANAPRQTVYLGVEAFWFNPEFKGAPRDNWYDRARYLVSANTLRASLRQLRRAPWELEKRWRRVAIAGRCVIGRTDVSIAWRSDGSRLYGYEIAPRLYHPSAGPFTRDLTKLDLGFYDGFTSLSESRLHDLTEALDLARRRGWRVVGFTLPNPSRYVALFRSQPELAPRWRAFSALMPRLFHARGFAWLDLSDVRSVPCAQNAFADRSFHPDATCSMTIRRRLDEAVKRER